MDDIVRSILGAARPRRKEYATLRLRNLVPRDIGGPPFVVEEMASDSRIMFNCVVQAVNHLHSSGFVRLGGKEGERWVRTMNSGMEFDEAAEEDGTSPVDGAPFRGVTFAVFVKESEEDVKDSSYLTGSNLKSAVVDLVARPVLGVMYCSSTFGLRGIHVHEDLPEDPEDTLVDEEEPVIQGFGAVETGIMYMFGKGWERMDRRSEEEWTKFIDAANSCIGPDDGFAERTGKVIAIFVKHSV